MNDILKIILFSGISGITIFLGGILAKIYLAKFKNYRYKVEINHFITAFGGGIIVSALALVLIPKGLENLSVLPTSLLFLLGPLVFFSRPLFSSKRRKNESAVSDVNGFCS
ncbi:hypothetical protein ACFQ3R_04010 [Mesonia ostreae]|uniref:Uncharacterized protein n=1 Tax=Mesonia ostreae TaxID=861110 RepID=A0ABU2KJ19_9FLAO|nr:hypothetical protein [Mesonia ostreae]MDT0294687.1 hypothetical protein [Mesonia ostreae]